MPTLHPFHWCLLVVFLGFYGFAVFAVTRDYYVRHPIRPPVTAERPARPPPGTRRTGPLEATDAIPTRHRDQPGPAAHAPTRSSDRRFVRRSRSIGASWNSAPTTSTPRTTWGSPSIYTGDTAGALEVVRTAARPTRRQQRILADPGLRHTADRRPARRARHWNARATWGQTTRSARRPYVCSAWPRRPKSKRLRPRNRAGFRPVSHPVRNRPPSGRAADAGRLNPVADA